MRDLGSSSAAGGVTASGEGCAAALVAVAGQPARVGTLKCVLTPDRRAANAARHRAHQHFVEHLPSGLLEDLELVLGELVANAVAVSGPADRVDVNVDLAAHGLLVEVADQSPETPAPRPADTDDEDGRGLLIVDALTESWGWRPNPRGKVVWGLLPLTPPDVSPGAR
ncbi:ATP-binding protein [Kitasatospora sp. NBC_00240]|uniref:ATP-binding protein n=1 Tax=Kitasatospora sp. NBC_00240 TaxID=2903567 RepID=UPI002252D881|nr:ATP-binding protein [Kitasatospora sp. NBC_00240]MCX5211850.1 ATP-binding protein [Kitasatospora sp. NBC_00240]